MTVDKNNVNHNQPSNQGGGKGGKAKLNGATPADDEGQGGSCNGNNNERSGTARSRSTRHASNIGNDLKRRRRHNNNIPAARFIQEYNEHAYISDQEEDEREYLPTSTRKRRRGSEGNVVQKLQQQQQQQQQEIQRQEQGQESAAKIEEAKAKNDASALSIFAGRKRNARCYCFNCW